MAARSTVYRRRQGRSVVRSTDDALMFGTPLQSTVLIGMVVLFVGAGVFVCIAAVMMAIGAVRRVRGAAARRTIPQPADVARQRRVRRLMFGAAALTAASFMLSALGQII